MTKLVLYAYATVDGDWLVSFDSDEYVLICRDEDRVRRAARLYERYGYAVMFDYPPSIQAAQAMEERDHLGKILGISEH